MPLLNRQEHPPGAQKLSALKDTEEVFVLRSSGEAVKSYGDFIDKQTQYSQPVWQDRYYGRTKLTYYQALALEKSAEEQLRTQVGSWRARMHRLAAYGAECWPVDTPSCPTPRDNSSSTHTHTPRTPPLTHTCAPRCPPRSPPQHPTNSSPSTWRVMP